MALKHATPRSLPSLDPKALFPLVESSSGPPSAGTQVAESANRHYTTAPEPRNAFHEDAQGPSADHPVTQQNEQQNAKHETPSINEDQASKAKDNRTETPRRSEDDGASGAK